MIVDDSIAFRFYTRTLSEDYRVFAGGGGEVLNYAEEFAPLIEFADVSSDDEASAVIFEDSGNVYVAAFGMRLNRQDRAGREIGFSFCLILPAEKKAEALRAFSHVISEWQAASDAVNGLLEELPVERKDWKGRAVKGEDVRFDQRKFLHWLTEKTANVQAPKAGYMLKYFDGTGEIVSIGTEDEDDSGDGYTYKWVIGLLVAGAVCVGLLMWYFMPDKEPSKPQELPLKSQGEQSRQQDKSSPASPDATSKDPKEAIDNGGHNRTNSSDSDSVADAQEAYNGRTGGEGSISQNTRSDDAVGINDRSGNDQSQGGDDTGE